MNASSEQHGLSLGISILTRTVAGGNEPVLMLPEANAKRTMHKCLDEKAIDCSLFHAGESWHGAYKMGEEVVISSDHIPTVLGAIKSLIPGQRHTVSYGK